MIVVNLKNSYADLIRKEQPVMWPLQTITSRYWPKMRADLLEGHDILVGTFHDVIVSAFRITGVKIVNFEGVEKLEFELAEPIKRDGDSFGFSSNDLHDPLAWLIGCPIPGGPWVRGESRGTRRYSLEDYKADFPEIAAREGGDYGADAADRLLQYFRGDKLVDPADFPAIQDSASATAPATAADAGVTVVRQPGGTVVVTIPTGVRARIEIDPDSQM